MNNKLVSVIIPVYNAEFYIQLALESVSKQTYQELEVIVIDDGSTDGTLRILETFCDPRIKVISRGNRGLISTLNECIELSSGEYIARMDADDICYPTRIEEQIKYLSKNKEIGVLFTGLEYIDAQGKVFKQNASDNYREVLPAELLFGCPVCHPTAIFNMNVLTKTDILYNNDFKNTEDFELWTRLISKVRIGILGGILFQYRVHERSITSSNNLLQREMAVSALSKNLINTVSEGIIKKVSIIYNNHQGSYSNFQTLSALFFIFLNLKKMNVGFSYNAYVIKSYRLMRKIIFSPARKSLR